jgi:signal transduction histidine kinase
VSAATPAPAPASLRRWLTGALLCIAALPPLAVLALHAALATSAGPSASALAAARGYAIDGASRWTDPAWQAGARAYFAAQQADAELRPARGPWFSTVADPAVTSVPPADKFTVAAPDAPSTVLGSGWVIPRTTTRTDWAVPLAAGAATLALTVAATGIFLGRHVVRPLAAISRAAPAIPYGEADLRLPATRVGEVAAAVTALQAMSRDLHAALERQADMEEQRRQFIGAVAHDLRTPLFTLRAYLDGLNDGLATSPDKASQYLQACRTSASALDRLVTDLFSYARMEYLGQQPRRAPVDLAVLLRAAARAHQPRAGAKRVTLTVTAASRTVAADEHLLTRVIDNLVDNAVRHAPEGGRVDLHCAGTGDRADDDVTLTVTDDGPGIAAADLPHLFTPLYRGEASRNRATGYSTGGTGLGLAIAHRILLAHGGTLTAANVTPHGARFTARLPATAPPGGPPTGPGAQSPA